MSWRLLAVLAEGRRRRNRFNKKDARMPLLLGLMAVLLMVGLGVDELSMTPWSVMSTKKIIRSINFEDVRDSALTVLQMDDAESVNSFMRGKYAQTIRDLGISSFVGQVDSSKK